MDIKRIARGAVLAAVALTIFVIELQLPDLIPVPGVKLGLANIVTLIALYALGPGDALAVLAVRVLLGALFSGNPAALIYSVSGGALAFIVMLIMRRVTSEKQVWVVSVFAAMAHNLGQILAAMLVTGTPSIAVYLPVLIVSGVLTGLFTGLTAQVTLPRLEKILRK